MNDTEKYSILIVDDDDFLVDMYVLKFTQSGHHVRAASSVEKAIAILAEPGYQPDAVLIDLVMPKMDGFDLLTEIRNQDLRGKAKLIVLSNQGEKSDLERVEELGADGHIIKANAIPSEVLTIVEGIIQS